MKMSELRPGDLFEWCNDNFIVDAITIGPNTHMVYCHADNGYAELNILKCNPEVVRIFPCVTKVE